MHLPERRRREHGLRVAFVEDDFIGQLQLLEQPEDALRAAVFQMVNPDHDCAPGTREANSLTSLAASVAVTVLTSRGGCSSTTSAPTIPPGTRWSTCRKSRTLGPPGS